MIRAGATVDATFDDRSGRELHWNFTTTALGR